MSEWQPIETAPKDETEVLVFVPNLDASYWWCLSEKDHGRHYPAHSGRMIARFYDGKWVSPMGDWSEEGDSPTGITPTHWMPLPEPPVMPANEG